MASQHTDSNTSESTDNQNEFTIRTARRKDIPDITRLNAQLGYPVSSEALVLRYRRIMRDRRNHQVFVAVSGGSSSISEEQVIGWIHVYVNKLLTVGPLAEIGGLVVDERWHGRRVGTALVRRAEQWARQKRLTQVVIYTNILRTRAHAFYEKCSYQLLKQSKVYIKEIR